MALTGKGKRLAFLVGLAALVLVLAFGWANWKELRYST